jgi:glucokinase
MLLVGDVGGTKTHLALFDGNVCIREEKYFSRDYKNLEEIVAKFKPGSVEKVCFGVAGPVLDGKCQATNLPWVIDAKKFKLSKVFLINDMEAMAWGIRRLEPKDLLVLNKGKEKPGNRAIIAAGTGLGEAGLFWNGKSHEPFGTEGGHADFAARDELEKNLWLYLHKKYGHVSFERVLSGPGLEHLYWFFVESGRTNEKLDPEGIARQITEKCDSSKSCREILDLFVSIYGGEAGNLALKLMATGGIFIGGGIAPRITKVFESGLFMRSFLHKGRFESLLLDIPVKLILNDKPALLGAAEYASTH